MTESSKNRLFIVVVMVFLTICLFLYFAREILTPFFIAAFIAYLISPLIVKVQFYGYRRWVGVTIIAGIFISVFAVLLIIFVPVLINEIEKFNISVLDYYEYFSNYVNTIRFKIEAAVPLVKQYDISNIAIEKVRGFIFSQVQQIPGYLMSTFSVFSIIFLIPVLVLFMMISGDKTIRKIVNLFPSEYVETILSVVYEIDVSFGRFIRGQLIEIFFVGVMTIICLSVLGVNFALIIGIIAGLANIVPYLGPFVGLLLALIVGIIQFQTFSIAVKIIIVYIIIQFLDNNLVQPFVVGRSMNLGPLAMIFAMLAGGQVFGFLGIVFAVPVMSILKTIFIMFVHKYKRSIT